MLSNIDEHVRQLLRRPAESSAPSGSRKRARSGLARWKAPRARGRSDALTCSGWKWAHVARGGRASVLFLPPMRGVRGLDSAELPLADKAAELSPPPALRRERGSRSTRSRRRAVKHGAVGGRMTARRSGAVQRTKAATLRPEASLEVERWRVFPRRPAESLQRWCFRRGCS